MLSKSKFFVISISLILIFFINGCGNTTTPTQEQTNVTNIQPNNTETKTKTNMDTNITAVNTPQTANDTEKKILNIGIVPSSSAIEQQKIYLPFAKYLQDQINYKIQLKFAKDYETIADKLGKDYDVAIMGAYSYLEANSKNRAQPIVKAIRNGKPYYKSIIIASKKSNINKIEDIKGNKKIVFVDRFSTAGFLFPAALLYKKNINISKNCEYKFVRGHDNVVRNVASGSADVGACFNGAPEKYLTAAELQKIKIIAESEDIPSDPIVVSFEIFSNKQLYNLLLTALKNLKDQNILSAFGGGLEGYIEAYDKDYNILREKINLINKLVK